jgi:hypothetical protein
MSYVTLSLAKSHLAVIGSADDTLIQQCLDAAESYCASYMGRNAISDIHDCPWIVFNDCNSYSASESEVTTVPAAVVQAVLIYTAEFYENRTLATQGVPLANALLHMHRVGLGV